MKISMAAAAGLLLMIPALAPAHAETARLVVGQPLARFDHLKPGVHRYLRYKVEGDKRTAIDIWVRSVRVESQAGQPRLHLTQRWDEVAGPVPWVAQESWFETGTMRPLTHVRSLVRDGGPQVAGYVFHPDKVTGMADLPQNSRKDFEIASPEPAYNFEYDMELLQTLPLAKGYAADIVFYDPGRDPPAHYVFKVDGEAEIAGPDGRRIPCWIVTADYNTGKVVGRFWFAKGAQVLIREESAQPDGTLLVKTLLPPEAGDV